MSLNIFRYCKKVKYDIPDLISNNAVSSLNQIRNLGSISKRKTEERGKHWLMWYRTLCGIARTPINISLFFVENLRIKFILH